MDEEPEERQDSAGAGEASPAEEIDAGKVKSKAADEPFTLEQAESCDMLELAKDKARSRQLQRTLSKGDPEVGKVLLKRAEPFVLELAADQFGNYLTQKLLEVADEACFRECFQKLKGRLLELAQDMHGTRVAQKVVEQAVQRGFVEELIEGLPPDAMVGLACSVTGFHVVAKLLEQLPADRVDPFLETLCKEPMLLATDQWGCCVLKKCIDRSEGDLRQRMVDTVVDSAAGLVKDPFGNYIVQHLLIIQPNEHAARIVEALQGKMLDMCMQKFSSNVLEKCLMSSSDKDRDKIINEILNGSEQCPASEAVRRIIFHQFGNYVFQQALNVAKDPQFSLLVEHSKQHIQEMICRAPEKSKREVSSDVSPEQPAPDSLTSSGSLSLENARRLALKLVKRYPSLLEGMDPEALGPGTSVAAQLGSWYSDSWAGSYTEAGYAQWGDAGVAGPEAFAYASLWDPSMGAYLDWTYATSSSLQQNQPAGKKGRGKGAGSGRTRSKSQRQGGSASQRPASRRRGGKAARGRQPEQPPGLEGDEGSSGFGGETMKIGRVVGYWPNYTIEYDEVPLPPVQTQASGRGKRKGKGNKPAAGVS